MKESDKILLRRCSPFKEQESVCSVLFIALLVTILLSSCNNKSKDTRPFVGSLDSAAIAADTTMQLGLEQSYEFNRTLPVNKNVVYDVIAWGTPTKGLLSFVYRNDKGVLDTVVEMNRLGIVKDCWVSDMNKNGKPEVMAVLQNNDSRKLQNLIAVEVGEGRIIEELKFDIKLPKNVLSKYNGQDNIYYVAKENALYHEFPMQDSTSITPPGMARIKFELQGNKFEAVKFEETKK